MHEILPTKLKIITKEATNIVTTNPIPASTDVLSLSQLIIVYTEGSSVDAIFIIAGTGQSY